MQDQTAIPAPHVDGVVATDAVELSGVELLLSMVMLLLIAAFASSLIKWILLLRRGARLFGEQALVPARERARPYWNPALFIFFFGVLIVASLLLNGWATRAGLISTASETVQTVADEKTLIEEVVRPDSNDAVPLIPDSIAPDSIAPDNATASGAKTPDAENVPDTGNATNTPAISVPSLLLSSASMLLATIVTIVFAQLFRPRVPDSGSELDPTAPRERPRIGCLPRRGDISLGFRAAWLILLPTMLLMGLVTLLQKYSHPVLEALKPTGPDASPDLSVFAALFFTTAIITPFVEEFWFRGMLQGGLQRLADLGVDARRFWDRHCQKSSNLSTDRPGDVSGEPEANSEPATSGERDGSGHSNASPAGAVLENPYAPPQEQANDPVAPQNNISSRQIDQDLDTRGDWTPTAVWPIIVTSLVFAVMHWGQGPAPIPLFFLSLGLGYLYRQTGSLVPSIVVHFILNGFTMCVTLLQFLR
ncbi:CPBP family intramembrane glutamic endopeptidase [Allorhodopirellula heiligendammensis]|uniref:CAAX amino terminal protease self- immunity n=1 Tax=Allorhodopirellula heiligendammensis TaxID=2714739 RepID=A0A5C6BVC6_9BACT|nr:CPBP family intramembrane glutamic endopeptidase [Allorhodopirellula heiligendammensis]TWU15812.1 CAAX amino terminal protease self- immunity [Allorhodopirellula heiligendammensis]